jgi:hypothetical protein
LPLQWEILKKSIIQPNQSCGIFVKNEGFDKSTNEKKFSLDITHSLQPCKLWCSGTGG